MTLLLCLLLFAILVADRASLAIKIVAIMGAKRKAVRKENANTPKGGLRHGSREWVHNDL